MEISVAGKEKALDSNHEIHEMRAIESTITTNAKIKGC